MQSVEEKPGSLAGTAEPEIGKFTSERPLLCCFQRAVALAARNPKDFIRTVRAALRGAWYACLYRLIRRKVRIRLPFFAYERVTIQGNGRVEIGRWSSVLPNVFVGLRIVTLSPTAVVRIGREASLGGLTIRCRSNVFLGDCVQTAYSLIQNDWLVHSELVQSRKQKPPVPKGVHVGDRTWLAMNVCVLGGSRLGRESVISAGSVSCAACVPEGHLATGNPIRATMPIGQLVRLRR